MPSLSYKSLKYRDASHWQKKIPKFNLRLTFSVTLLHTPSFLGYLNLLIPHILTNSEQNVEWRISGTWLSPKPKVHPGIALSQKNRRFYDYFKLRPNSLLKGYKIFQSLKHIFGDPFCCAELADHRFRAPTAWWLNLFLRLDQLG